RENADVPRCYPQFRNTVARRQFRLSSNLWLLLVAFSLLILHTVMASDSALLRVRFQAPQHTEISLWVDDELAYSMVASDSTSGLQPVIGTSPGRHSIRILLESAHGTVQEQRFISDFSIEREKELLVCSRGSEFTLAWGAPGSLAGSVGLG